MKKIEAYIKERRLNEVMEQLHLINGLTGASVMPVRGYGRMRGHEGPPRIVDNTLQADAHVKVEIMCADSLTEKTVETIRAAAHTGLRADGKIYISTIEDVVKISTGQRGEEAV